MMYVSIALLLVLGFLGAIQLIAAREPRAQKFADKLAPYQGWIGVAGFAFGAFYFIRMLTSGWFTMLEFAPFAAIVALSATVLLIVLGAMFGVAILRQFAGEEKAQKVEGLLTKLRPMQGAIGLASIACAVLILIV